MQKLRIFRSDVNGDSDGEITFAKFRLDVMDAAQYIDPEIHETAGVAVVYFTEIENELMFVLERDSGLSYYFRVDNEED